MSIEDDYQYILALSETGSLSAAARQLNVNHTTVARRIQAFEARFNVKLFERVPKGYQLTSAGLSVLPDISLLKEQQLNIERKLAGHDNQLSGEVNLTLTPELANDYVIPALNELNFRYPNIQINLLMDSHHKDLYAREADIALRFTPTPTQGDLIGKKLFSSNWGVYASAAYLQQLPKQHRLLLWQLEFDPNWYSNCFAATEVVAKFDQLGPLITATKNGLGIAKLPCGLIDNDSSSTLYRLDLPLKPSIWNLWLLYHSDLKSAAKVTVVKDFLIEHLTKYASAFSGQSSHYWQGPIN
ncbi:LysR family transcriptional regulator [Litorilituus sediminis]|uniref:LysR family transcriptional regulator n=1 Tax=Litorilituus sediminis TaxID=718192 RepID=A0A4P6P8A0_9GAMM|nr:LysR family transcriptional regulator [Litorilituus sediminis]QBG35772.1 LysR family transcriptional regulator [Litorilituus sediminis]